MTDSKLLLRPGKRGLLLVLKEGNWSKGMLWHRRQTKYGARGMSNLKVSSMNVAVKSLGQNVAENVRGLANRTGALGVVFAVSFDIAEYLSTDGERFLSDLQVSIGFTLAGAVLSAVVGAIVGSAAIALAAGMGVLVAPWVIAAVGIGAVVGAGFVIGRIVSTLGLKEAVQDFFRDLDWYEDVYKSDMTDEEIEQGMKIAP